MLLRDPQIKENMLFAFTELSTSITILISPLANWFLSFEIFEWLLRHFRHIDYDINITLAIVVSLVLLMLPIIVSYCVLSPRIGFQLSMIIDFRIYFSLICKHKSSMKDLVRARRNILFVTLFHSLLITGIAIFGIGHIVVIPILTFSFISGTFTIIEIIYIFCKKKSFLNWVFLSSLNERT